MASRYENNRKDKLPNGDVVYRSKIYPSTPLRDDDIYIVTQTGDRLDTIAHQFYNDQSLWWIVATANNIHKVSFTVPEGTILRIPKNYIDILNQFKK